MNPLLLLFLTLLAALAAVEIALFHRGPAVAGLSEVVCWLGEG